MLEQLILKNFQKHRDLTIDFDPHVTTIIGDTNAGKTAILRALYWLCFNSVVDKKFTSHGEDFTRATLYLDDGKMISRYKGPKGNTYHLNDLEPLKAVGVSVPEPIAALLNLDDQNFQMQLDQHFWFSDSAGQVSKKLNAIVNLELIDDTITTANEKLRKARTQEEFISDRLREAQANVKELEWVETFDTGLKRLEDLARIAAGRAESVARLASAVGGAQHAATTLRKAATAHDDGEEMLEKAAKALASAKRVEKLSNLIATGKSLELRIKAPIPNIAKLTGLVNHMIAKQPRIIRLNEMIEQGKQLWANCKRVSELYLLQLEELNKQMEGKCPVCGNALTLSPSLSPTSTSPTNHHSHE